MSQIFGGFKTLTAGGYICKILACKTEVSKSNKQMLVINFDIAEGEFKDWYLNKYKSAPRDANNPVEPKWQGKYYLLLEGEGYEGRLKAFTTSVEESNEGYTWDWNEENLKGKLFGAIFREEEFIWNGAILTSCKIWQARSTKKIRANDFDIPRKKELTQEDLDALNAPFNQQSSAITDDDLPF